MAVVKTEAYGHGAYEISTRLEKDGVKAFAVATIDEGIRLRCYGIRGDILILGFTFKENCPDVRNTKVIDIYNALKEYNVNLVVYDPWANPSIVKREYDIEVMNDLPKEKFDAVVMAVAHKEFVNLDVQQLTDEKKVIYDVKWMMDKKLVDGRL